MNANKKQTNENEDDFFNKNYLLKTRTIFLSGAINEKTSDATLKKLIILENEDAKLGITILINSPGGEISSGFAIFDMMKLIPCPIKTVVTGLAASMGSLLSLAADTGKRFAFPNAKIMIHQPLLGGVRGQATDLAIHSDEILKTRSLIAEIYAKQSGKTVKTILKDMERDKWFTSEQALGYGLLDGIIHSRQDF